MLRIEFQQAGAGSRIFFEARDLSTAINYLLSIAFNFVEPKTISLVNDFITSLVETVEHGVDEEQDTLKVYDESIVKLVKKATDRFAKLEKQLEKETNQKKKSNILGLQNDSIVLTLDPEPEPTEEQPEAKEEKTFKKEKIKTKKQQSAEAEEQEDT